MKQKENESLFIKVNQVYQRQIGIYNNILKLTEEQKVICNANDDKDKVLNLINKRLQLLNSLDNSNAELNIFKKTIIDNLVIKEFRIGLIKEKYQSTAVEQLADTLSRLGETIRKINELDKEIRQFYDKADEKIIKITSNPQKVHQAYKVFLDGKKSSN